MEQEPELCPCGCGNTVAEIKEELLALGLSKPKVATELTVAAEEQLRAVRSDLWVLQDLNRAVSILDLEDLEPAARELLETNWRESGFFDLIDELDDGVSDGIKSLANLVERLSWALILTDEKVDYNRLNSLRLLIQDLEKDWAEATHRTDNPTIWMVEDHRH